MEALKKDVTARILKVKCEDIESVEEAEVIVGLLEAALREAGDRYCAISAPETNVAKKAAIIRHFDVEIDLINPIIISKSAEQVLSPQEHCVSFSPDLINCVRHSEIEIENGLDRKKEKFSGKAAALVQHEIDHLNGIIPYDRAVRVAIVREGGIIKNRDFCVCGSKERFFECCKNNK